VRTTEILSCLGDLRSFDYDNLSLLRFAMIAFNDFSFVGADLTRTTFQGCEFTNCNPSGTRIGGCRLYDCTSDEITAEKFASLGIEVGPVGRRFLGLGRTTVPVENDDPVVRLVAKFFRRFIRGALGANQRTAGTDSMLRGLGGEERKFTEREILPEMKRNNIIGAGQSTTVFVFNSDWQSDGDSLLAEDSISDRLRPILDTLRSKSRRYNLT
jgi:hypothetical protein